MARRQGGTEGAEIKSARVLYSRLGDGTSGGRGRGERRGDKRRAGEDGDVRNSASWKNSIDNKDV